MSMMRFDRDVINSMQFCCGIIHIKRAMIGWNRRNPYMQTKRKMAHAATNLRQEIAICTKAPELIRTLKRHEECIDASDVFAAWEVVLRRNLLSFQSKGGSRGETGQGKRETKGKAAEPVAVAELRGLLMEYTMPRIASFAPRELSVIARAMVSTKSGEVKDVLMISEEIGEKLVTFEPQELCMVLWAVSSHTGLSKDEKHNLFLSLSSLVEKGMGMDLFMAHDLSILVWSMGVVGFQSAQLIEAAERESVNKIEDFDTGSVARMMHGFAELRYNPNTLLPLMTARYEDSINAFSPQDFTLMLVSLGKLVTEPSLKFLRRSAKRAKELLPQEDASTQRPCLDVHLNAQLLWAFARLGVKRTAFTTHSLKYVMVNMEEHTVEDLSAVLWACCRLGDLKLPAGFVQQAVSTLRSFDPASAPQSYAQCLRYILILYYRYKETSKVDILAIEADMVFMLENLVPSVCSLSNWDLCTLVIALSPVPIRLKPEFVRIFQEEVARSIESLPSSLIPKLAFAVGKLRWSSSSKLIEGLAAAIEKKGGLISADVSII